MDELGDKTIKNNSSKNDDNDTHRKRRSECVAPVKIENQSAESSAKKIKTEEVCVKVKPKQEEEDNEVEDDVFFLLVSKIPYQWSCEQVTDYINENCAEGYALEQLEGGDPEVGQRIRLTFSNFEKCNQARKQLKLKAIDGQKLHVVYTVPGESESDDEMDRPLSHRRSMTRPSLPASSWEPNIDVWATDPTGTYGLKPSYLESLGIKPPIDNWIHVSNFRCDKTELKEVLELAGQVVICRVVCAANKYATVMYSHPLEAVQAVAMIHGQTFYGQVLKVSMYKCVNKDLLLPKGLVKIGPGLGEDGKPLRDIVQQYDRYLNGKTNCINDSLFNISCANETDFSFTGNMFNLDKSMDTNVKEAAHTNESNDDSETSGSNSIPPKTTNIPITTTQPHIRNNPDAVGPVPLSGPVGPSSAPVHADGTSNPALISTSFLNQPTSKLENKSLRPGTNPASYKISVVNRTSAYPYVHSQNTMVPPRLQPPQNRPFGTRVQQPFHNPIVSYHNPINQGPIPPGANTNGWARPPCNINVQVNRNVHLPQKTSSVVELSNLPLSTTFPILSEKMGQVGQVISLELTRIGCAVVRFATHAHAERCYQHYNKLFVMGNVIEVKFL